MIYKICNPLHRSDRKISEKTRHNFGGFEYVFRIIHSKFRIFQIERAIFRQNLDEILSEFHEHAPNVKNFQFHEKNSILRKSVQIPEMFKLFR